jgi:hypothetical protein
MAGGGVNWGRLGAIQLSGRRQHAPVRTRISCRYSGGIYSVGFIIFFQEKNTERRGTVKHGRKELTDSREQEHEQKKKTSYFDKMNPQTRHMVSCTMG